MTRRHRPFFNSLLGIIVAVLTLSAMVQTTVLNYRYVGDRMYDTGSVSTVVDQTNKKLQSAGLSGDVVTEETVKPLIKTELKNLYTGSDDKLNTTKISKAIREKVQTTTGIGQIDGQIAAVVDQQVNTAVNNGVKQILQDQKVTEASQSLQEARQLNLVIMVISAVLTGLLALWALIRRHFWRSAGPSLLIGGILAAIGGSFGASIAINSLPDSAEQPLVPLVTSVIKAASGTAMTTVLVVAGIGLIILIGHAALSRR